MQSSAAHPGFSATGPGFSADCNSGLSFFSNNRKADCVWFSRSFQQHDPKQIPTAVNSLSFRLLRIKQGRDSRDQSLWEVEFPGEKFVACPLKCDCTSPLLCLPSNAFVAVNHLRDRDFPRVDSTTSLTGFPTQRV